MSVHLETGGCKHSGVGACYVDDGHLLRTAAWQGQQLGAKDTWDDWCLKCLKKANKRANGHAPRRIGKNGQMSATATIVWCECGFMLVSEDAARTIDLHAEHQATSLTPPERPITHDD